MRIVFSTFYTCPKSSLLCYSNGYNRPWVSLEKVLSSGLWQKLDRGASRIQSGGLVPAIYFWFCCLHDSVSLLISSGYLAAFAYIYFLTECLVSLPVADYNIEEKNIFNFCSWKPLFQNLETKIQDLTMNRHEWCPKVHMLPCVLCPLLPSPFHV